MSDDPEPKGERTLEWDRVIPVPDSEASATQAKPDGTLEYFEMIPLPEPERGEDGKRTEKLQRPAVETPATLDSEGLDTRLARYLHEQAKLDLPSLINALRLARGKRAEGFTLARALVEEGLLPAGEVEIALTLISKSPEGGAAKQVDEGAGNVGLAPTIDVAPPNPDDTLGQRDAGSTVGRQTAAEDPWQPGKRVGAYLLLQRVGSGGMGTVFLAEHTSTHARYALKTIPASIVDPDLILRLQREGEAQARAGRHPNVAAVIGTGVEEGRLYLVMEYVAGGTLSELLQHGPLPVERAAQILRGIALGLDHTHQLGVLHRDIKPANVLMDPSGLPKLVDFGIARVEGALTLTATGEIVGTPAFMSPEQALGERERFGPKMDVYSVGILLYVMLTGDYPFKGSTHEILTKIVMESAFPRPRELRPEVPEWLESLCLRAMAKDPMNRPSAKALAQEVEVHLSGRIRRARAPLPPAMPSGPRRRRPVLTLLALLGGAGLFALGMYIGALQLGAPIPGDGADAAPPTSRGPVAEVPPDTGEPPGGAVELPARAVWAWTPGEEHRFELATTTDLVGSQYGPDKFRVDLFTQFEQRWLARRVDPRWVTMEVEIERLVVRWEASMKTSSGQAAWNPEPMDFDSRRHRAESPFGHAVGRTFEVDVDPTSGRALVVRGVGPIQEAIYEALGDEDRTRYRIPELSSDEAMQARLNAVIHLLMAEPRASTWKLERGDPLALGGSRDGEQRGGFRPLSPPTVHGAFRAELEEEALSLSWKGSGVAQQKPYEWTSPRGGAWVIAVRTERSLEGAARLQAGRLLESSVRDEWTSTRTGRPLSGSRGQWSAASRGSTTVGMRELIPSD